MTPYSMRPSHWLPGVEKVCERVETFQRQNKAIQLRKVFSWVSSPCLIIPLNAAADSISDTHSEHALSLEERQFLMLSP